MAGAERHETERQGPSSDAADSGQDTDTPQRRDTQTETDGQTRRGLLKTVGAVGVGSFIVSAGGADRGRAAGGTVSRSVAASSSHVLTETGDDLDDWRVLNDAFGTQWSAMEQWSVVKRRPAATQRQAAE